MAGLPPGDPQLVSMIVNHLKTQGLFDQFRRDCLADVDTKPAYLNLKQRVDNFVSNHLSNHTWSPHLNKNQLRNNIRQLVLQSGMLEQGVDRIVAQVVDPKINHTFRPHVERVVQEFLSPGSYVEEPPIPPTSEEEKPAHNVAEQASVSAPTGNAMSILDTITTLNQEASCWASSSGERSHKGGLEEPMQDVSEGEQDVGLVEEGENGQVDKLVSDVQAMEVKTEDDSELTDTEKEGMREEMKMEDEEAGTPQQADEGKDKTGSKALGKPKEEGQVGDAEPLSSPSEKHHIKQKARERLKEEYSLEDSDLEGLSDITVSSVHTSDLSSLEDESDDEVPPSESSEDGEVSSDGDKVEKKRTSTDNEEDKERKPRRQGYVHKPFLYSRYYSDSDDEVTVEQRRRSVAKDKEERLLKRQQNRERMEEKRKQRAAQLEEQNKRRQETESPSLGGPRAKEARKEKKVLEKKMALSRKRKRDSRREEDVSGKKKGEAEGEGARKDEAKAASSKSSQTKSVRKVSELASDERLRRKSGSTSEDSVEPRKMADKSRTHSFILDLEQGSEESLKQRPSGKFDRPSRKEPHPKERKEKECSGSDERSKLRQKSEKKAGGEEQKDESQHKEGGNGKPDDKGEKKTKVRSDKKLLAASREGRASVSEGVSEEGAGKKGKTPCAEAPKVEKDKEKSKEKGKDEKKTSAKSDARPLLRDSTGSSEERSDMEPGPDGVKRKDKPPKEAPKRSKSHTEDVEKAKHVEKTKSKSDGEEKKPRGEHGAQESQKSNKSNPETEKESRKSRESEPSAKGKSIEKSRSKSREDLKAASSSRMDKKPQGTEVKSKGGATTSKPDTSKDRKKEASVKQFRRGSEETPPEKTEDKTAKKVDKRIKIPEKKGEAQLDDRRGRKGEEGSERSSVSSPAPELGESLKKSPQPKDTSTDSDPTAHTVTTSISDDTYDALSDITPEPEDDDMEQRLSELEPRLVVAESDALLTLMDVCTSEDARLGEGSSGVAGDVQGGGDGGEGVAPGGAPPCPELAFQDADMKMKEAALTLLSMDPDSTVPSDVVPQVTHAIGEETLFSPLQMETTTPQGREQQDVVRAVPVPISDLVRPRQMDEHLKEPLESQDVSKQQSPVEVALQEDVVTVASTEQKPDPDSKSAVSVDNITTANATEVERLDLNAEGKTEEMVMEHEERRVKMDSDNISADQSESQEDTEDPVSVRSGAPQLPEEVRETRRGRQSRLVKQASNASKSDGQEDERGSEKEDKTEGRVTRTRRLSSQKAIVPKDLGDEKKEKESQEEPPKEDVEETEAEKASEPRAPRRGRSSKTTADQEEQPQEPEKPEETAPRRGRRSGAQAKEASASDQKKDEEKKDEEQTGVEKPDEKEQKDEVEKSELKRGSRRGRPPRPPPLQPETRPPPLQPEASPPPLQPETRPPPLQPETRPPPLQPEASPPPLQPETRPPPLQPETRPPPLQPEASPPPLQPEASPPPLQPEASQDTARPPPLKPEASPPPLQSEASQDTARPPPLKPEASPPPLQPEASQDTARPPPLQPKASQDTGSSESKEAADLSEPRDTADTRKAAVKRKRSEDSEEPEEEIQPEEDDPREQEEKLTPQDSAEEEGEDCSPATQEENGGAKTDEVDKEPPKKKPVRRGRPSKGPDGTPEDSEKKDPADGEKEGEEEEEEQDEEEGTRRRTTTRSASRLEAERNKPSKPSTRASRLGESAANTHGARGQASVGPAKGGRKREASPPAPRTRGGQKSEEPPPKRTKR